jgi:hypothetical protein
MEVVTMSQFNPGGFHAENILFPHPDDPGANHCRLRQQE